MEMMENNLGINDSNLNGDNVKDLTAHLKTHNGEKSNICGQCDYASSQSSNLKRHLKTHSGGGEKSNKCKQCDYASYNTSDLKRHSNTNGGKNRRNAPSVVMHPILLTI